MNDFDLTSQSLLDISRAFREKVEAGLARDRAEIKCLPAFIPAGRPPSGNGAYVLDLGGSNLRAAVVSFDDGCVHPVRGPLERPMPWKRNAPLSMDAFLDVQADLLASLGCDEPYPLGYCFSYPAVSTPDRDAVLLTWTKGIDVPGTCGRPVGAMLAGHIRRRFPKLKVGRITVVNDTVAALFAGLTRTGPGIRIGLVAGTGTNMAAFVNPRFIPKLENPATHSGMIPVNLESGNFNPPHLTRWDDIVDENSENPGRQRFEKAVSGLYLSRIFRAAFPEGTLDEDAGAKGLIELHQNGAAGAEERQAAGAIYVRSARLAAAGLGGLISLLSGYQTGRRIFVTAEGALFHSLLDDGTSYAALMKSGCCSLLDEMGLTDMDLSFLRIKNANLLGSAIAAASY